MISFLFQIERLTGCIQRLIERGERYLVKRQRHIAEMIREIQEGDDIAGQNEEHSFMVGLC